MEQEELYLRSILEPLVTGELTIERKVDDRGILLEIYVDKSDMGRVIGKHGTTADAIRKLVRQFGSMQEKHVSVRINEPNSLV